MTHCLSCLDTPCTCGARGYLPLWHADIHNHVLPIRTLMALPEEELDTYLHQIGELVMEMLKEQENLEA